MYCPAVEHKLLSSDGQIAARGHGGLQKKKKKGHRPHVVMKLRLQSPSKPTLFICVQNFTPFFMVETAQRGQNNCAQLRGNIDAQCVRAFLLKLAPFCKLSADLGSTNKFATSLFFFSDSCFVLGALSSPPFFYLTLYATTCSLLFFSAVIGLWSLTSSE